MPLVLSEGEKNFLRDAVREGLRLDQRSLLLHRNYSVELDPVPQASGSARVQLKAQEWSSKSADVLVAIKADIVAPSDGLDQDIGELEISVEDTTSFERTLPHIASLITDSIPHSFLKQLVIQKKRFVWKIFIDCMLFDSDGGIPDAVSVAVRLALLQCKLPDVIMEAAGESSTLSMDTNHMTSLDCLDIPIHVTIALMDGLLIVDPTANEEASLDAIVVIGVRRDATICSIRTEMGVMAQSVLLEVISLAQNTANSIYLSQE